MHMRTKILNLPSSVDNVAHRSVLWTDKNLEVNAPKRNDLMSPRGGSVMSQNVKWARRTKDAARQPGNAVGEKVSK